MSFTRGNQSTPLAHDEAYTPCCEDLVLPPQPVFSPPLVVSELPDFLVSHARSPAIRSTETRNVPQIRSQRIMAMRHVKAKPTTEDRAVRECSLLTCRYIYFTVRISGTIIPAIAAR